jgi:hypothetical protein
MNPALCMRGWVEYASFTIADKQILKLPVGSWPKDERLKECGSLMRVNLIEGVDALQLPF